jgi:uncharacterized membrane protein YjjP (DUF1212 family)
MGMEDIIAWIIIISLFVVYLYFGYRDDYRRNPKQFKRIILGIPISFVASAFGLIRLFGIIKKWIQKAEK